MLTMSGSSVISKEKCSLDSGKYVRYTNEQVEALERLYNECPKPSSLRRQQLIRECPILQNIEPKQIKVWFQNRRCREKQRKEYARLQAVNGKLTAMNKLLMEENDRLQKQLAQLHYENNYLRQQGGIATTDTSCDSVVTSGLQHVNATPQHPAIDVTHSGILSLAEEALTEFLAKATGTAVEWVQMPGMKPGPDSAGMVNIAHGCNAGVAARAGGMVALEPTRVASILKDRASWCRDCRRSSTLWAAPAGNGGTLEILYMQMYAPTTMAPARDFCTLRYSSSLEDGGYVICERSLLGGLHPGVPTAPPMPAFARAEMRSSGCLIRPCGAGGSVVIIVDHFDLEPWTVPEIVRPLYESSAILAEKMSLAAFRHLSCIAQESAIDLPGGGVVNQQPAAVRSLSHRLARGFNDAINTFVDEGWTPVNNADHDHGLDDVQVLLKPSSGVVCAKASMPLQAVSPSLLVRFLREHRSEWADHKPDPNSTYSSANLAASMRPFTQYTGSADFSCTSQLLYPQVHSVNQDELLELIKLEDCNDVGREDSLLSRETLLLQHCSGLDEKSAGPACAQMVFGPIDTNSVSDEVPLLPSGFRVVRLDRGGNEGEARTRTLDLASALEVGPPINGRQLVLMDGSCGKGSAAGGTAQYHHQQYSANAAPRSLLTLVFQFPVENRLQQDALVPLARQFVRYVMVNVRRIVTNMAALLHHQALPAPLSLPPAAAAASPAPASSSEMTAQGLTLAHLICKSYKRFVGMDLVRVNTKDDDDDDDSKQCFEQLWQFSDAVMCCSCKTMPMFTFANQAGLDMLETTPAALYELSWEETLDEEGKKSLGSTLAQVLQQGYACLPAGLRLSSTGRLASYDRAIAWKVLDVNDDTVHGVAFVYLNWSFM